MQSYQKAHQVDLGAQPLTHAAVVPVCALCAVVVHSLIRLSQSVLQLNSKEWHQPAGVCVISLTLFID